MEKSTQISSQLRTTLLYLIVMFQACAGIIFSVPAYAQTTLKLGHVAGPNGPIGRAGFRFQENLEAISNGNMRVDVHTGGTLGGIRDLWAQMQIGVVDMQVIDLSAFSLLKAAQSVQVVLVPYLFEDQTHFREFAESDLLISMLKDIETETNIKYLGIMEDRAPRIISTTGRPIKTLSDVVGLKIRVPPHPMFIDVFKNWGAVPTPLPPAELFTSLKTGIVEAEDNGIVNLANGSLSDVIKHVSPIDWSRSGVAAWISVPTWSKLSKQEQTWVAEAAKKSARESKAEYQPRMEEAMEILVKKNINIVKIDQEEFRKTSRVIEDKYAEYWPSGLPGKIRQLAR